MRLSIPSVVAAVWMLLPGGLLGQQVDPSVQPVDPSVNARVQDPDHPASALLPGGSSAWTGQPIMSQTASGPSQKGSGGKNVQFPSLTGMSTWGTLSVGDSSASNAADVPERARSVLPSTKTSLSRKLNMTVATVDLHSARSSSARDELADEENQLTRTSAAVELRKLRQGTARSTRSARIRVTNPLSAKADAASAGRWHSDQSSAYALNQQEHESGMLLQNGFYDRSQRRRHRHHGTTHTLGSHD